MQVPVPAPDGVNTPPAVMVPPVAVQETAVLKAPVPETVAEHVDVCPVVMEGGIATTVIPVTVADGDETAIFADPEMFVKPACAECAVQVPVPAPDGVKIPPAVMVPPVAVQVTAVLNAPVPDTVAEHVEVCAVVIEDGIAATAIPVTVTGVAGDDTVIFADPEMFVKPACAECAVQVPVPAPDGVKIPPAVMVPPVAVQVTAVLKAPVPATVAAHVEVCDVVMEEGTAATPTDVTVIANGGAVTAILPVPDMLV